MGPLTDCIVLGTSTKSQPDQTLLVMSIEEIAHHEQRHAGYIQWLY